MCIVNGTTPAQKYFSIATLEKVTAQIAASKKLNVKPRLVAFIKIKMEKYDQPKKVKCLYCIDEVIVTTDIQIPVCPNCYINNFDVIHQPSPPFYVLWWRHLKYFILAFFQNYYVLRVEIEPLDLEEQKKQGPPPYITGTEVARAYLKDCKITDRFSWVDYPNHATRFNSIMAMRIIFLLKKQNTDKNLQFELSTT